MDAVEFLKEAKRYCRWCKNTTQDGKKRLCEVCYFENLNDIFNLHPMAYRKFVEMVEQWSKEHPVITRQSKLLNLFPLMGAIEDGCINICPLLFDRSFHDRNDRGWCTENDDKVCPECKRRFWMEELKEGET
nr:MAG TPA: hypothetical protein [Caudoviricetes sp.]